MTNVNNYRVQQWLADYAAHRATRAPIDEWPGSLVIEAAEIIRFLAVSWQPMETAPKDGREVVLAVEMRAGIQHGVLVGHYMPGGHCIEDHPEIDPGWYFWNGCMFDKAAKPTSWMPLPHHPSWGPGGWQAIKAG